MKKIDIKVGDSFLCTKDVKMSGSGIIAYHKGKVYRSDSPGRITDEQGCIDHIWENVPYFYKHFMRTNIAKTFTNRVKEHKDNVNHPSHYTWLKDLCGIEVIDITRHLDFDLGNAIKYILRAGHKSEASMSDKEKEIEDLKKAIFYIQDRISTIEKRNG